MMTSAVIEMHVLGGTENNAWIHTPTFRSPLIGKIIGLVKDILFTLQTYFTRIAHRKNYSSKIADGDNPEALCVLLHGLNGHPSIFDGYHDGLQKNFGKKVVLFQPFIPKRGNCSIEYASERICKTILNWARKNKGKPIVFCGVSNGARVAAHIASKLVNEKNIANPIQVNAIAGPFYGSKRANQPDWSKTARKIWRKIIQSPLGRSQSNEILDELAWGSEKSKALIENMRAAANTYTTSFNFFATRDDSQVIDYHSSWPKAVIGARYFYTENQGHQSIVPAVRDDVIGKIKTFLAP